VKEKNHWQIQNRQKEFPSPLHLEKRKPIPAIVRFFSASSMAAPGNACPSGKPPGSRLRSRNFSGESRRKLSPYAGPLFAPKILYALRFTALLMLEDRSRFGIRKPDFCVRSLSLRFRIRQARLSVKTETSGTLALF
jgi:hypothetical protein